MKKTSYVADLNIYPRLEGKDHDHSTANSNKISLKN